VSLSRESESGPRAEPTAPLRDLEAARALGAASRRESESGPEPTAPSPLREEAALGGRWGVSDDHWHDPY
jgi:hypothetical protein